MDPKRIRPVPVRLVSQALYRQAPRGQDNFYYVCDRQLRHGKNACPYAKYHAAKDLEERVGAFVLELIRNPETLREQVEAEATREKSALRETSAST
jgi:hypothetical protein